MTSKHEETDPQCLEVLREVSGEQKLKTVFGMWEMAMELKRAPVRMCYPGFSEEEVRKKAVAQVVKIQIEDSEEERKIAERLYRKHDC